MQQQQQQQQSIFNPILPIDDNIFVAKFSDSGSSKPPSARLQKVLASTTEFQ
jgi:hypothetical protein